MTGRSLPVEDACALAGIFICALPLAGEIGVRGLFRYALRAWPGTDWSAVSEWLRSEEQDAARIAGWLDDEARAEEDRQARLRGE